MKRRVKKQVHEAVVTDQRPKNLVKVKVIRNPAMKMILRGEPLKKIQINQIMRIKVQLLKIND